MLKPGAVADVLASPLAYLAYQSVVGGIRARRICLRDYAAFRPGMVVIDVGCGPGYTAKWLHGSRYFGFDTSPKYIAYARRHFGQAGSGATYFCDEFRTGHLQQLPRADLVLMFGLLHHLDDGDCASALELARGALNRGGRLITLDGCRHEGASRLARAILDSDRGRHIRDQAGYERIARAAFPEINCAIRDDLFFIPYRSLVLTCSGR